MAIAVEGLNLSRLTMAMFVAAPLCLVGCGGGTSSSTSTPTAPTSTADPRVLSCSQVSYRGVTQTVTCSNPNSSLQPSAVASFFGAGRTDCLISTCAAGCVSSVRAGTLSGSTCQ